MKLVYRGLDYNYTPAPVAIAEGNVGGKYRGMDWRFRNLVKVPVQLPTLDLIYRGVAYQTHTTPAPVEVAATNHAEATVATPTYLSVEDKARELMMTHHRLVKNRQQAMLSRLAVETGVVGSLTDRWSRIQGKIQPTFWANYDRSHAAMS